MMASKNQAAGQDEDFDVHTEKTISVLPFQSKTEAREIDKSSYNSIDKTPVEYWKLAHAHKSPTKPKCDCDIKNSRNDLKENNVRTQAINLICCISQQTVYSESLLRNSQLSLSSHNTTVMYEAYARTRPIRFRSVSESLPSNINKTSGRDTKTRPMIRSVSASFPTTAAQMPRQNILRTSNQTQPLLRRMSEVPTVTFAIPRRKETKSKPPLIRSVSEMHAPRSREANILALKARPGRIRSVSESLPRSQSSESHKKFQHERVDNVIRKVCSLETIPEDRALILEPQSALASKARFRGSKKANKKDSMMPTETPPPEADKGWAWVVLAACLYNTIMVLSFGAAFGIQFGPLLADLGLSATATAWIFNVQGFLWNLTPVVAGPLCRMLGWRMVGLAGAIVSATCFTSLAFANSPIVMFLLYGVVLGLAGGTLHNVTALILPRYFFKHRGLALGLNSTAVGISQIIMPHLITALLKEYGYLGSILIRGGLLLNCCVAVSLFRPLKFLRSKQNVKSLPKTQTSKKNENSASKNNNSKCRPVTDPANTELLTLKGDEVDFKKCDTKTKKIHLRDVITEIITNIRLAFFSLKSYRVLINVVMYPNFLIGYINFGMIVPFYMASAGHGALEAAWALTLSAVSSSLARLFTALLSDRPWFSRSKAFIVGSIVAAISSYGFVNVQSDLKKVYFTMVMWGLGVGTSISLRYVLLIDTVGMDVYVPALGACGFAIALTFAVVGPIFGVIRDASSSYSGSLGACAVLQLSAALLWLFMPCAQNADKRKEKRREEKRRRQKLVIFT